MNDLRLVIAGTSSGVGQTMVTLAILAALGQRGRRVQPFKAGPDFIDPGHHTIVAGRSAKDVLIEEADLVTEMKPIEHPFRKGGKAQVGVEL